jgi:hypothetical protein
MAGCFKDDLNETRISQTDELAGQLACGRLLRLITTAVRLVPIQGDSMNLFKYISLACMLAALCVPVEKAFAQFAADPRMTRALVQQLESIGAHQGVAFVSGCSGPEPGKTAILVLPLDGRDGLLSLLWHHQVYSGAGISIEQGRLTIVEGVGGEWSMGVLQFYANELAGSCFRMKSGDDLRGLITSIPNVKCLALPEVLPKPVLSSHAR